MKNKKPFDYYTGIHSLEDIAPKEARVCVMNILGNESRGVTPVSHAFSKGNVVAGVQYGRSGILETEIGDIPVYSRLADVMPNHGFDTGVIYLPPEAVFYAVTELCHYNKELQKIIIITEKISVKDQRLIRAVCQANGVDVFGANCLGVADSWNHVRIGGALGGDRPEETLIKGSVAIHSNSGNFSTTIAEYLKTEGFGTTTIVSSGKDMIIHYAVPEFFFALKNDPRSKAAVLYVEPGGYYERQALDLIESGKCKMDKPLVVCITGRWKANLTRACGHAGALAGEGDDALSKEKWFDEYFGVPVFDPEQPQRVSERGVRVASIQHIPAAMKALYDKMNWQPDFEARGDLGLKSWFGNDFKLKLPLHLKLPVQKAMPPYDREIEIVNKQLGATYLRRNMRNASGASRINPTTQVAELHGVSILELSDYPFESNMMFALIKRHLSPENLKLINLCLNLLARPEDGLFSVVKKAKSNGAMPNQALIAAAAVLGDHPRFRQGRKYLSGMIEIFSESGLRDMRAPIRWREKEKLIGQHLKIEKGKQSSHLAAFILQKIKSNPEYESILKFAVFVAENYQLNDLLLFLISAIILHAAYPSLLLKKITRNTAENLFGYLSIEAQLTMLAAINPNENALLQKILAGNDFTILETSFTEVAYQAIFNESPAATQLREFSALLALTLTNGQGTISAKGAKESVSARNHIATAYAGFLANTGLAHGGSGYEAVEYLLNAFKGVDISDPGKADEQIDAAAIGHKAALEFLEYKNRAKLQGKMKYRRIPCINHPVFKGKRVNIDPREDFIRKRLKEEGIENIYWDFYHRLVESLYKVGATNNVYCVNIDAVIAVISLKLMHKALQGKKLKTEVIQDIGFLIFLLGRMAGVAAEIVDHTDRGQDMDCRTPLSETVFIS